MDRSGAARGKGGLVLGALLSAGDPVAEHEDLRRAVWPIELDDLGFPSSASFTYRDHSVDVASLAPLIESRERFRTSYIAIVACQWYLDVGARPIHEPLPWNNSHAVIPGRLSKTKARKVAARVRELYPPVAR